MEAVNYLARSFSQEIGLIYETPDKLEKTYWIYSDNYLAQLALAPYAQNETIASILGSIESASRDWTITESVIVNQYQILNRSNFVLPIKNTTVCKIGESNDATIMCTINNGTGTLSSKDYADIAFLEAIAYQNSNQTDKANLAYQDGVAMWNGIGFNDTAYRSYTDGRGYDTYKLALYIYASRTLNQTFDVRAYNNLLACQLSAGVSGEKNSGGFATYYTANGVSNNQTNTETTALAILALTYEPNPVEESESPDLTIIPTPSPSPHASPTPTPTKPTTSTPTPRPTTVPTLTPIATPTVQPENITGNPAFYIVIGASVLAIFAVCFFVLRSQRLRC
jgi:hypothetical protein